MKNFRSLLCALLILSSVITACQAVGSEVVEVTRVVTETEVQQEVVEVTRVITETEVQEVEVVQTPTPVPDLRRGGTLRVAMATDIDTFDPHISPLEMSYLVKNSVFNTLVKYDESLNIVPDLAEWEVVDPLTWIFHLEEGVKFHNGRDMTAEDVKYSLERGQNEELLITKWVTNLESVEIVDDNTVQVKLIEPRAFWLNDLVNIHILPEEEIDTMSLHPVGTGPFRFVEWRPNDQIVLERFDDYWDEGKPYLDRIVLRVIPDVQAAIANLESGDVDAVREITAVDALRFLASNTIQIEQPEFSTFSHFFHMMGANNLDIWGNHRVRQALAHCLDKETIRNTVFLGQGQPVTSLLMPSSFAYKEVQEYEYDPQKTRQILEEEGITDLEFTVEVATGFPDAEKMVTIWQAGCAEAGVTINLNVTDVSIWLDMYLNQDYDVIYNTFGQNGDPTNIYFVIIGRFMRGFFCGESGEEQCYQNEELAQLMEEARVTVDQEEVVEILGRMQDITAEELPVIMVQTMPVNSLTRDYVEGWEINARGDLLIQNVWLNQ